jgi:hypothetical protein
LYYKNSTNIQYYYNESDFEGMFFNMEGDEQDKGTDRKDVSGFLSRPSQMTLDYIRVHPERCKFHLRQPALSNA